MNSVDHYKDLEIEITSLLNDIPEIKGSDRLQILDFIEATEYGLALEQLVGAVMEVGIHLPATEIIRIENLTHKMELKDGPLITYLKALSEQH